MRRSDILAAVCLVAVAVVHLLPVVGVAGPRQLDDLYGIGVVDSDVDVLLRHRAILLGLVGLILLVGAFVRGLRTIATVVGLVSASSFVVVAVLGGTSTSELHRVLVIDVVAVGLLFIVAVVQVWPLIRPSGDG